MIRTFIEQSTRHLTFQRRLPKSLQRAPVLVSPSGGLRYIFKSSDAIDPPLLHFVESYVHPGHVVWDIGANVGLFSVSAAVRAGRQGKVFSFEPDSWLVDLLRKTSRIQSADTAPIEVLPVGVGGQLGFRRFGLAKRSRSTNHLEGYGTTQTGGISEWITVFCVHLDWAFENIPLPNIVKIDVEGAELELLTSGHKLLSIQRPILHLEVSSENSEAVSELLRGHGYRLLNGEETKENARFIDRATPNTIAIPT